MDDLHSYDFLLIEAQESTRRLFGRALIAHLRGRVSAHASARNALTSYTRTRFDAIVCGATLSDTDCWRFIRMVRSGRFGYPDTPVFVVCEPTEHRALAPMLDAHTMLVASHDPEEIATLVAERVRHRVKATVLVIEDEPEAASAAARAIEKHYDTEIAYNGTAGLNAWRARRHQLVLLDLMLPGMSGADVLREILQTRSDQPVIVLTAHDAPERHRDLILAGATEFLGKPLDTHFLAAACARVLHDHSCLASAADARGRAAALEELAARVHAAEYTLSRGRTAEASHHLVHALQACRTKGPTDDQWTALMNEFAPQRMPPA